MMKMLNNAQVDQELSLDTGIQEMIVGLLVLGIMGIMGKVCLSQVVLQHKL
jgi:hypothetical protein